MGFAWWGAAMAAGLAVSLLPGSAGAQAKGAAGPTLDFREASGCQALLIYTWNEARTEVLVLHIDQSRVRIKDGSTDLEIGPAGSPVTAELEVSDRPRESFPYCDDGAPATERTTEGLTKWPVASGKVKVIVKRRPNAAFTPVSIGIDRMVLQGPDGQAVRQRRDIQFTAAVAELK